MDGSDLCWRKTSYSSGNGGNCVEIASLPHAVAVRDSKDPGGPVVRFAADEWGAFVTGVKDGLFAGA
ncbi:DUF397 domain-containing protein [Sphaerisporangium album]|uniref:DUF397 domain-containing protein n=1 Tax=Sphaerisporangium album TaxID=509200 RepID=A0A367FIG0_9ACTN|nr:DUF397 domain-containing protein [Sphaerisporangium album]RCG30173.1 DUF397 domain-containing protein [Sphaerisporangium album]